MDHGEPDRARAAAVALHDRAAVDRGAEHRLPDRGIAISPDGSHVCTAPDRNGGGGHMVVRAIDQLDARPLPGITAFRDPFISPDGLWIGFFQPDGLKKISMTGGPSIALCPAQGYRGRNLGTGQ